MNKLIGFSPKSREYMTLIGKAMSGDIVLTCTPATLGSSAATITAAIGGANAKFVRTVTVALKNASGEIQTWFNGTLNIAVAEVTAGSGVSAIAGGATTVTLVDGVGTVTIEYTGVWATADTQTLTVTGGTKLGYTVANKTSVDTVVA